MELYKVCRIDEDDYGCEELPEGEPVRCRVTLQGLPGPEGAEGSAAVLVPDADLAAEVARVGDALYIKQARGVFGAESKDAGHLYTVGI